MNEHVLRDLVESLPRRVELNVTGKRIHLEMKYIWTGMLNKKVGVMVRPESCFAFMTNKINPFTF